MKLRPATHVNMPLMAATLNPERERANKIADILRPLSPSERVAAVAEVERMIDKQIDRPTPEDERRLELELACAAVYDKGGLGDYPGDAPATLLMFEYAPNGNIAYKTALPLPRLASTIRSLLERWKRGETAKVPIDFPVPTPDEMCELVEHLRSDIADKYAAGEIGIAVIIGEGKSVAYGSTAERAGIAKLFVDELLPQLEAEVLTISEIRDRVRQVVRDWHCPPGDPKTASATELLAMNVVHVQSVIATEGWQAMGRLWSVQDADDSSCDRRNSLLAQVINEIPRFEQLMRTTVGFYAQAGSDEHAALIESFLVNWRLCAYARLEVGHKLAASFCLTDVPPEMEVRAPWPAWSLVIPDGLLGEVELLGDFGPVEISRVWLRDTEIVAFIDRGGAIHIPRASAKEHVGYGMIRSLALSACLALDEPDQFRKQRQGSSSSHANKRHGPPDLAQARFMLSAPVKIDLRQHLREVARGEHSGSSPKVQFFVRGHWRNQAHGKGRALRRRQWIEGFWKGDEDARILLRGHRIEE